jgi:serine phosphatase RsbU (regulator of sigma subunit)
LRGVAFAEAAKAKDWRRDMYEIIAESYAKEGNFAKGYEYQAKFFGLRDSLVNDDISKRTKAREARFEADKKDVEIKLLKKDAENQALVRNSLLGGLSLVGVLAFVLVISNNRRKKANTLLQEQAVQIQLANTELQEKNVEITEAHVETQRLLTNVNDSIRYAKRIQDAMLPSTETLNRLLPEHFIFFRPKDVVSGDFYWCKQVRGLVFVAAVDCTGHGVPGAFMSLIGNSLLNDITQRLSEPHPDVILNELHRELQTVLRQRETNNDDGMDICLCMIDKQTRIVEFAGAINPLYAVVAGELREFKGTPEELGGREERSPMYARHVLDLSNVSEGASMLYLTTDGYKDQYNDARQRFMPKRLRPLLTEIAATTLEEQPRLLGAAIDAHKGEVMQVDDMLVLGVRV